MLHEDELPEGYPYDLMYPFSIVNGVRLFPEVDADGWVSVEDCLPEPDFGQSCLFIVATADGRVLPCYVNDRSFRYYTIPDQYIHNVTHWRPFPLPPKEKR